jgi:hypothetical protein
MLLVVLSFAIGLCLALLGGGGSILTVPLLVYGLGTQPKVAIATSLFVVMATSVVGLMGHARSGHVAWRTGLVFGAVAMIGAFAGGIAAQFVPDRVLMVAFASVMAITAVAMMFSKRLCSSDSIRPSQSMPRILAQGFAVGTITGLVGTGGGFLVVPALVLFGGLSMRLAIGTSLLVIAMNSVAGLLGHLSHSELDPKTTLFVSGIAAAGALTGSRLALKIPTVLLRRGFAWVVLALAVVMGIEQLPSWY